MNDQTPISCTLGAQSYKERMVWTSGLFARSLQRRWREGASLHLLFDKDAKADVEKLVRQEQDCCAFLEFALSERGNALKLVIAVPPSSADNADALLSPFDHPEKSNVSCACAPTKGSAALPALAVVGLAGGSGALLCAAGCVLPGVLLVVGIQAAWLGELEHFAEWRWPFLAVAGTAVAGAWSLKYITACNTNWRHTAMLTAASLLIVLGATWSKVEPLILQWLSS